MSASPTIVTLRRGWIAVPVLDDETGRLDYWDIHRDEPDWATNEVEASVSTLGEARRVVREQIADERRLAALLRFASE